MQIPTNLTKLTWKNPTIWAASVLVGVLVFSSPLPPAIAFPSNFDMPDIEGSANVGEQIKNIIEENPKIAFSEASLTAQNELAGDTLVKGNLGIIQGYLVYSFAGINSEDQTKTKIIVDAADGQVLYKSEPISFAEFTKFQIPDITTTLSLSEAANVAKDQVDNGVVKMGKLRLLEDNTVYKFKVADSEQDLRYSVTIDANTGEVLDVSEGMSKSSWGHHGYDRVHKWKMSYDDGQCGDKDKEKDRSESTPTSGEQA